MEVNYSLLGDKLYFYLCGELDEHYAKSAKEYIDGVIGSCNRAKSIVFNMAGLTFMDSTGIGMLLGRYKRLKKIGKPCYIENPTVSVEKVLELAAIYDVMPKI